MTQDQYGQSGGSGYDVRNDALPSDDVDDSQGKPMTRFQKVASALLGDRPERDETATDRPVADDVAATGDMPTNPDVPPTGTGWGTHPGDATTTPAAPDDALDPQGRDPLTAEEPVGGTVPDGTGVPAGSGVAADSGEAAATTGTAADARAQRDYWDEPSGTATGADPALAAREPEDAASPDVSGGAAMTPTFTPAPEASAARAGDQPDATMADVPAAGAPLARDDTLAGRNDELETAGTPAAAGSPAAEGIAATAGTTTPADAPVTGTSATGTPATGAPVAGAPVAGAPVSGAAVTDDPVTGTATGAAEGDLRPGEAAGKLGDFSDLTFGSLIPDAAAYTDQWQQVQFRFVDDPRGSVTEAAEIVRQVTSKLEGAIQERLQAIQQRQHAIQDQQKTLDSRWGEGSNADTETLRETLRMYKTFLDQLVGPKA
jgi:hypothetical protein